MNLYNSLCVGMSNYIAKGNSQHGCNMHFYRFAEDLQKIERSPELIDVITYRDLCRLISPPNEPNMDCYRVGCHSPTFAMEAFMTLSISLCVVMSNYIAKGNGQHGCNMHFSRFAEEFQKNREEP